MLTLWNKVYKHLSHKQFYIWLSLLLTLLGIEIVATVLIPVMKEFLFNGIEQKNVELFIQGMWMFFGVIGTFCICQGFKYYTGHRVGLIVRSALTKELKIGWTNTLDRNASYDNPDQRISEDCRLVTESAIEVAIEILISIAIIIGIVLQMWGEWLLLGLSFGYTFLATIVVLFFHRPMINAEKNLQRAEADFRFDLAGIAMKKQNKNTKKTYKTVISRYLYYVKILMGFTLFNKLKGNLMSIVPFLVLVPMFFSDSISFGEVMKGVSQFDLIVINATILILMYPKFTKAWASYERIHEFYRGLKNDR